MMRVKTNVFLFALLLSRHKWNWIRLRWDSEACVCLGNAVLGRDVTLLMWQYNVTFNRLFFSPPCPVSSMEMIPPHIVFKEKSRHCVLNAGKTCYLMSLSKTATCKTQSCQAHRYANVWQRSTCPVCSETAQSKSCHLHADCLKLGAVSPPHRIPALPFYALETWARGSSDFATPLSCLSSLTQTDAMIL